MTKQQKERILSNAFSEFKSIDDERNLKRNKLLLNDYYTVRDILDKISKVDGNTSVHTLSESVAEWFKRNGFIVYPPNPTSRSYLENVNYTIVL